MSTALVYGWYGKGNVGDELMAQALSSLFVSRGVKLEFVDSLKVADVERTDAVIFGGGSILYDDPVAEPEAIDVLRQGKRPVFYLGVGLETDISPVHLGLMTVSKCLVTRSPSWKVGMSHVSQLPDFAYNLSVPLSVSEHAGLLVVPNVELLPRWSDPHWMHLGWERFKDEFAQFLDYVVCETKIRPTFLLMCQNRSLDDAWAANEIVSRMCHREGGFEMIRAPFDAEALQRTFERYQVVFTQRFHGIVMGQASGTPTISIDHHDKLTQAWPKLVPGVSYHGVTKRSLIDTFTSAFSLERKAVRVSAEAYSQLANSIVAAIEQGKKAQ